MEWMFTDIYIPDWLYYSVPLITICSGFLLMMIASHALVVAYGMFLLGYGFGVRRRRNSR